MKRKIISNTYLREAIKYQIKIFLDEDELLIAYQNKDITDEDYKLVYRIKEQLLDEIKNKTNKYMNLDYTKYLDNF